MSLFLLNESYIPPPFLSGLMKRDNTSNFINKRKENAKSDTHQDRDNWTSQKEKRNQKYGRNDSKNHFIRTPKPFEAEIMTFKDDIQPCDINLETALIEVTLNVLSLGHQGQPLLSSRHNWIKVTYINHCYYS